MSFILRFYFIRTMRGGREGVWIDSYRGKIDRNKMSIVCSWVRLYVNLFLGMLNTIFAD